MVFSSVPLYLDPPNWNQQGSADAVTIDDDNDIHQLQQAIPQQAAAGGGVRLGGSMAERARLAKIPQPEAALKCPRCDSTNTKFCYFNNYSLTQPRHFCKTCRRYWTRGGALRSVPVGGGCRRNKRTAKPSSSSKPSMVPVASSNGPHLFPSAPLPFAAPWHHIHDYGFGGIQHPIDMPESGGLEQWRIHQVQQPPFLGGLAPEASVPMAMVSGLYQFEGDGKILSTVKVEESTQAASSSAACLPKQFFTMGRDEGQIWPSVGGGEHVTGFSSSAGHLL